MGPLVLGNEQMEPLLRTKALLEELIETMDIMSDRNMMESIRRGEDDLKAGRTRDYGEFIEGGDCLICLVASQNPHSVRIERSCPRGTAPPDTQHPRRRKR